MLGINELTRANYSLAGVLQRKPPTSNLIESTVQVLKVSLPPVTSREKDHVHKVAGLL